jgi:hypothetical protein
VAQIQRAYRYPNVNEAWNCGAKLEVKFCKFVCFGAEFVLGLCVTWQEIGGSLVASFQWAYMFGLVVTE